jgi:hypothetical protein
LQPQHAAVSACDRDRRAEIDDEHALGMRQLAPRGEATGALPIIALAVNVIA